MPHEALRLPEVDPPATRPVATRHYGRWLAILVLSVLVHLLVLDGLPHWSLDAAREADEHEPLRATIAPIVPPKATVEPAPLPAVKAQAPARQARRPPPAVDPVGIGESLTEPPVELVTNQVAAVAAPVAAAPPTPAAPPAPAPAAVRIAVPPSGRLDYTVISQNAKQANPIYGKGTITWAVDDGHYATDLQAEAELLVFRLSVLASHSDGAIGPDGLVPDRYIEAPRKRATLATNFNRDDRQSITFSASTASVPLVPGAQDRLSVLFQIGALIVGDPGKTAAGATFEIPVAGVRGEVETWRFDFIANETVLTGAGEVPTVHVRKAPQPGGNERTIDVWVAVANGGYPARVLYTEPSGNTVMMTLDGIRAVDAQ